MWTERQTIKDWQLERQTDEQMLITNSLRVADRIKSQPDIRSLTRCDTDLTRYLQIPVICLQTSELAAADVLTCTPRAHTFIFPRLRLAL